MTLGIFPIVEGHGDVEAIPILLRRYAHEVAFEYDFEVLIPYRNNRGHMKDCDEFRRAIALGHLKLQNFDKKRFLIIFDADDDCPKEIHDSFVGLSAVFNDIPYSLVCPNKEYESWFLSCLDIQRCGARLRPHVQIPANATLIRDAKGRFQREFLPADESYSETIDQARFTNFIDFGQAGDRSFEKLKKELNLVFS